MVNNRNEDVAHVFVMSAGATISLESHPPSYLMNVNETLDQPSGYVLPLRLACSFPVYLMAEMQLFTWPMVEAVLKICADIWHLFESSGTTGSNSTYSVVTWELSCRGATSRHRGFENDCRPWWGHTQQFPPVCSVCWSVCNIKRNLPQRPRSMIFSFLGVQADAWLWASESERMTGNSCTQPGTSMNRDAALLTQLDTNAVETSTRTAISSPPPRGKLNFQEHECRTARAAKRSCRCCLSHMLKHTYSTHHGVVQQSHMFYLRRLSIS